MLCLGLKGLIVIAKGRSPLQELEKSSLRVEICFSLSKMYSSNHPFPIYSNKPIVDLDLDQEPPSEQQTPAFLSAAPLPTPLFLHAGAETTLRKQIIGLGPLVT